MILFTSGIPLTVTELACLHYLVADPEEWLLNSIAEKARVRRVALIKEWQPILFADATVRDLPADAKALASLILKRPDYRTRAQQENLSHRPPDLLNTKRYLSSSHSSRGSVTLFPHGIDIDEIDCQSILAYVINLDDWIYGALLGQINRGKKLLIATYHPVLLADPDVNAIPATEDAFIAMILARSDYKDRAKRDALITEFS